MALIYLICLISVIIFSDLITSFYWLSPLKFAVLPSWPKLIFSLSVLSLPRLRFPKLVIHCAPGFISFRSPGKWEMKFRDHYLITRKLTISELLLLLYLSRRHWILHTFIIESYFYPWDQICTGKTALTQFSKVYQSFGRDILFPRCHCRHWYSNIRLWPLLSGKHWDFALASNEMKCKKINCNLISQPTSE